MDAPDRSVPMPLVWLAAIALVFGALALGTVATREVIELVSVLHERVHQWEN